MNKKIIIRTIGLSIIALIFYFLGKTLFSNWGQIKEYQFSFNYFYLLLSFIFLGAGVVGRALIWKKMIDFLQPDNDLSYWEATKIFIYSQFGKYLPGKVFLSAGIIYLARNKNIERKNLYYSCILGMIFPPIAAFCLSLFLIGFFFDYGGDFFNFYLIGLVAVIGGLMVTHPRVFQYLVKLFLTRMKKAPVDLGLNLSWLKRIEIIFYFSLTHFLVGFGFFCLINSITYLPIQSLLAITGIFILAGAMGVMAFFAPGGLGIKEGFLALFLQFYFPLNIAILISLLARVWFIASDLMMLGGVLLLKAGNIKNIFKFPRLYRIKKKLTTSIFFVLKQSLAREEVDLEKLILENSKEGVRVIDIGCGHGWVYEVLAKNLKNFEYVGVDPFPEMIAYCQKKYPQAKWLVGDLTGLGFSDGYFDLGIFCAVLHHMSSDAKVEESINKATRISKKVIIRESLQSSYPPLRLIKSAIWRIYDQGRRYYTARELNEIYKKYKIKKIKEFISHPMQHGYLALIKSFVHEDEPKGEV